MAIQFNQISLNLLGQSKIKKQIQKISKQSRHNKKNNYLAVNQQNIIQISKVSKNHLYLSDLITNLNPEELISILSLYNQLSIQEISPYKYLAQYKKKIIDFDYNEETEEIFEVYNDITIGIIFEIKQISECSTQYTILFQNLSKQYDIEYQNLKSDLIQNIIQY
ncbi:hypothetical protein TTHERM_00476770 (macronuclear) [Tetrahymena thermophila SB210]|uniref:Uncharacterized protein n=1 Tax=Tetrahymena thermophila (strain SB210) TaxID=312017 RepID=I7LV37_TETTS|nr:hypothetical protein TTHERM_00476770 [Tetrahymena thermophila SB210]EAR97139.1 hypothetical protein TTHERM_00476770 [Tetrahymena thermophila SB210]|eukprot:XP_001017384.1 hypothetical protein TTHERM_00476770 [Tetrahymena thermophila SB210]